MANWWFFPIAVVVAAAFQVLLGSKTKWPGTWGWVLCIIGIGIWVADDFKSWSGLGLAFMVIGTIIGFAGVLTSSNSPAK
ncbi:MAG: hypothetical protein WCS37_15900 [Chloroflexota bacterium]|nr:hypothetical protein [Chloroflexota bacterium]